MLERNEQTFLDFSLRLSPFKEIDKRIFEGDSNSSDKVCNFLLLLALVYNDLKFIQVSMNLITNSLEQSKERKTSGELAGMQFFIYRLNVALLHEFQINIKNNQSIIQSDYFKSLLNGLTLNVQNHWNSFFEAATSTKIEKDSNPFHMIRNNTLFHYGLKEIRSGYQKKFIDPSNKPCVSYGPAMKNTRFYYADAAIEGYFIRKAEGNDINTLFKQIVDLNKNLTFTLGNISEKFISQRMKYLLKTNA